MIDISTLIQTQLDHHLQAPPGKFDPFFPESALFTLIKYANTILFIINLKRVPAPPWKKKNIYNTTHDHQQACSRGPPRVGGLQPLQKFERCASLNGWTPEQQLNGFMVFLGGSALRVCQNQTAEVRANLQQLQQVLRSVCFPASTISQAPRIKQSHASTFRVARLVT